MDDTDDLDCFTYEISDEGAGSVGCRHGDADVDQSYYFMWWSKPWSRMRMSDTTWRSGHQGLPGPRGSHGASRRNPAAL